MVKKQIQEDKSQSLDGPGSILRMCDSSLLEEIISHCFLKKFVISSFDCYTGVTDLVQHLRAYQVKMVIHSNDDLFMCQVFPSSLKGVALDGLYSLLSRSLWDFEEVSDVFYNQ